MLPVVLFLGANIFSRRSISLLQKIVRRQLQKQREWRLSLQITKRETLNYLILYPPWLTVVVNISQSEINSYVSLV